MPLLYLRYVIVALNVGFVVAVAGITLATCLTLSLKTIGDNARSAVDHLGKATITPVDDFFSRPQQTLNRLEDVPTLFPQQSGLPSSSIGDGSGYDGGSSLLSWSRLVLTEAHTVKGLYSLLLVSFFDGTSTTMVDYTIAGRHMPVVLAAWPKNATHLAVSASVHDPKNFAFQPALSAAMAPNLSALVRSIPDQRVAAQRQAFVVAYNAALPLNTTSVRVVPPYFVHTDKDHLTMTLIAHISNGTQQLGIGYVSKLVDSMGSLLTEYQLTAGTRLFLFDQDGVVLAASGGLPPFDASNYTTGDPVPAGCTTTDQANHWTVSTRKRMACRFHITKYPHFSALTDATNADTAFFTGQLGRLRAGATGGQVRKLKGEYVYVAALPSVAGAYALTLAMVVPEADMLGDAGRILPIVAGATAAAVLIVAALSFALVWAVLRPLGVVAGRMGKAARLEVDPEAVALSPLAEIRGLQEAFVEMRDELDRIRAFVPQSLLRVSTDEDNDPGEEADLDLDATTLVTVSTRSRHATTPRETAQSGSSRMTSPATPGAFSAGVEISTPTSHAGGTFTTRMSHGTMSRIPSSSRPRQSVTHSTDCGNVPRGPRAGCKKGLRTVASVKREHVSVLMVNVVGYHAGLGPGGRLDTERAAGMVESVLAAAQQHRGVVDSFHGDRFTVSFNAARPCANHATRAALAALRIVHELGSAGQRATCGAASGAAFVGNVGSAAMKRFSVVGAVVPQAAVLERLCKVYGARCLVAQRSFQELGLAVALRTHDLVQLPGAGAACLVAEVLREHAAGDADEWMYQLQRQEQAAAGGGLQASLKDRSVAMGNDAWAAIAMGDLAEVRRVAVLLLKLDESAGPHEKLVSARLHDVLGDAEADLKPSPCDLGVFYNNGVCSRTSAI